MEGRFYDYQLKHETLSVNKCIEDNDILDAIANTIATHCTKFKLEHRYKGEIKDSHIHSLLERPNDDMSMRDLLRKSIYGRILYNNAFIEIIRDKTGNVKEFKFIDFNTCRTEVEGNTRYIIFDEMKKVKYKNIIHLRNRFNDNTFFGDTANRSLAKILNIHDKLDTTILNYLENLSVVKWIMNFTASLNDKDLKTILKRFKETYLSSDNDTGVITSDSRYTLEQVEDKSYVPNEDLYDDTRKRLFRYYNINDKILQSDYTESEYNAFYEACIEPILAQITSEFTAKVFTATEQGYGNTVKVNQNLLQFASLEKRISIINSLTQLSDIITKNEVRALLDLGNIENGDTMANRLDRQVKEETDDDKR